MEQPGQLADLLLPEVSGGLTVLLPRDHAGTEMNIGQHAGRHRARGHGVDEVGIDRKSGHTVVRVDARYFRPTEVESLLGDASKARQKLGWEAETPFEDLVSEMVASDLVLAKRDALMSREGYKIYAHHE